VKAASMVRQGVVHRVAVLRVLRSIAHTKLPGPLSLTPVRTNLRARVVEDWRDSGARDSHSLLTVFKPARDPRASRATCVRVGATEATEALCATCVRPVSIRASARARSPRAHAGRELAEDPIARRRGSKVGSHSPSSTDLGGFCNLPRQTGQWERMNSCCRSSSASVSARFAPRPVFFTRF